MKIVNEGTILERVQSLLHQTRDDEAPRDSNGRKPLSRHCHPNGCEGRERIEFLEPRERTTLEDFCARRTMFQEGCHICQRLGTEARYVPFSPSTSDPPTDEA